jgi:mono/diheme cytochrome c family protein
MAAVAAIILIAGTVRHFRKPESTPALRGEAIARNEGCFACHGTDGAGGVASPGSPDGLVPSWDGPTVATYARDLGEVEEWILDGVPSRVRLSGTGKPILIPMPAYRGRISHARLTDLMAYFRSVSAFGIEVPEAAYEGRKVAQRLGCFGCHGPSGIGGSPNPGSFKGHIPAWDGAEYPDLVRGDSELREWILDGHPRRLWDNVAARAFLAGQVIKMPPYRRYVSDDEVTGLVAYLAWIRKSGAAKAGADESHRIIGILGPWGANP